MSNYLAIATVTATLRRIIQSTIQVDVPGARVTTVRPETSGSKTPDVGVNIFLYQATPNPAWRNHDLRSRRPKGELIRQAQAGLDLYYLMSFYGNEVELEPQRLMGSTVRTIVDYPIITPEMIRETVNNPTYSYLAGSTLEQQVERVVILPSMMDIEELSKVWSVLFQTPYALSFACQGSAVLIEGNKTSGRPLPVRRVDFYTTPNQPQITQVVSEAGTNQPIITSSNVIIRGQYLDGDSDSSALRETSRQTMREAVSQTLGDRIQIRIGDAKLAPSKISEKEIRLDLSALTTEQARSLRAGVQSLQILHTIPKRLRFEPELAIGSNVMPFVLCPTIIEIEVQELEDNRDGFYTAKLRVEVDLIIGTGQRVLLFLNERSSNPASYIFISRSRSEESNEVIFPIYEVKGGEYLVRVQIDGAESPLEVDTNPDSNTLEQYVSPMVIIG
jgi:hypothetical protein